MSGSFDSERLMYGQSSFIDDIKLPDMLHALILRSSKAHANIVKINTEKAKTIPGVKLILTAKDLKPLGLTCMPTLAGDKQPILADSKVCMQGQEIALVVAETLAIAADVLEAIDVEYELLPVISDPHESLEPEAIIIRSECCTLDDVGQGDRLHPNHIFHWSTGAERETQDIFDKAPCTVKQQMHYPRLHPCPLETCGCVADFNRYSKTLKVHLSSQLPHIFSLTVSMLLNIAESNIQVIPGDIGGSFGNKACVYPAYILTVVASMLLHRPVKWIENRTENMLTGTWSGDYWMSGEIAADREGKILALRVKVLADHGAFNTQSQPSQWPAGFFSVCTNVYNIPSAFISVDGVFTNKAPGGIAYRSAFRSSEAVYLIERLIDILSLKLCIDKVIVRSKNFIKKKQFPFKTALGWVIDSGNYEYALERAVSKVGYHELLLEKNALREQGILMGIGVSTFTYPSGAGPIYACDSFGLSMCDRAEVHISPTGDVMVTVSTLSDGQSHSQLYSKLLVSELGVSYDDIHIQESNILVSPYSLTFQGSRAVSVASSACILAARKVKNKAKKIAAYLLEVPEMLLEWNSNGFIIKGFPKRVITLKEIAWHAYHKVPDGIEVGLEAIEYYKPEEFTFPFGIYFCVVHINRFTGVVELKKFYALNDCGVRINPVSINGQVCSGLCEGLAINLGQVVNYNDAGQLLSVDFDHYFLPSISDIIDWELDFTETVTPITPVGAKSCAEIAHIGSIPCFSSAIIDAFSHVGLLHMDMPLTPYKLWRKMHAMSMTQSV